MLIVETVYNKEQAMEITEIAKRLVVGNRARELAKQIRKKVKK